MKSYMWDKTHILNIKTKLADLYTTKVPPEYNLALKYLMNVLKFYQDLNEYAAKFMSQEEKIAYIQEKITVVQTLMI